VDVENGEDYDLHIPYCNVQSICADRDAQIYEVVVKDLLGGEVSEETECGKYGGELLLSDFGRVVVC